MTCTVKIEQTFEHPKRMKYIAQSDTFIERNYPSLSYERKVCQPYGWIVESGTPPCNHLDVIVMADKKYRLGDEDRVKVIGVFRRNDGDNKLVGVLESRNINDFCELTDTEKEDMHRLYPREDAGEGWFGREVAEQIINAFFEKKKRKTIITVQHTESQHHINGMIGAWGDWELTEHGKKQAYEIGRCLSEKGCNSEYCMYVSSLKRAVQTAEEINKTLHISPIVTDAIREVNAGAGNGQSREWYNKNKKTRSDLNDPDYKPFEDAESDRELWSRVYPFYQSIISSDEEKILIVSHGTALSFLQSMLIGDSFNGIAKRRFNGHVGTIMKFIIGKDGKTIFGEI